MASIKYNERINKWVAIIWLGKFFTQNQRSKSFEKKKDAIKWASEQEEGKLLAKGGRKRIS